MTPATTQQAPALRREVGLVGAIVLGLGSILGTGAFVSLGIATGTAGPMVIISIFLAGLLALGNGLSSARLAARHPVSGGTYEYGYRTLNPTLGFMAGWTFLCAKTASAAAAAMGCASYLLAMAGVTNGIAGRALAAGLVLLFGYLCVTGLKRSYRVNAVLVVITIAGLAAFIWACASFAGQSGAHPDLQDLFELSAVSVLQPHVFAAAAFLFVAFTGYGRVATLGEEVRDPARTIPIAVVLTLLVSMALYLAVALAAMAAIGAAGYAHAAETGEGIARLDALASILRNLGRVPLAQLVSVAAATAMLGVLLNLMTGLSRVVLAMARRKDLPGALAHVDEKHGVPDRAIWAVAGVVLAMAVLVDFKASWSFSAFTVLVYYAITNLAALRLPGASLVARCVMVLSLVGCLGLAVFVEPMAMAAGVALIAVGLIGRAVLRRESR